MENNPDQISSTSDNLSVDKPSVDYPPVQPFTNTVNELPSETASLNNLGVVYDNDQDGRSSNSLVLQWINYTLWWWVATITSFIVGNVVGYFMKTSSFIDDSYIIYGIASIVVLLPALIVCDRTYSKQELPKKTGASLAIMTIHAVTFVVICLSALLVASSSITSLIIGNSDTTNIWSSFISAIIIAILFAFAGFRTLSLKFLANLKKYASFMMAFIVVIIIAFGIFGPVAKTLSLKDDKLIENNLNTVVNSIESYVSANDKLPSSLTVLELDGDAKKLVTNKMVTFKDDGVDSSGYSAIDYKYQLCVTYSQKYSGSSDFYSVSSYERDSSSDDQYQAYLSTSGHKAGDVCYKLKYEKYSYDDSSYDLNSDNDSSYSDYDANNNY